jgi:transcriptional regulator with XRE-family HTH domain
MAVLFEGCFSDLIRRRREQLHLTQQQVADVLDVSPDFLSLVESGQRRLSLDNVAMLAHALALKPSSLCRMALHERAPFFCQALFSEPLLADLPEGGLA